MIVTIILQVRKLFSGMFKNVDDHRSGFRLNNVFIIGKGTKAYISLPRGKGVRLTIAEERDKRIAAKVAGQ